MSDLTFILILGYVILMWMFINLKSEVERQEKVSRELIDFIKDLTGTSKEMAKRLVQVESQLEKR